MKHSWVMAAVAAALLAAPVSAQEDGKRKPEGDKPRAERQDGDKPRGDKPPGEKRDG